MLCDLWWGVCGAHAALEWALTWLRHFAAPDHRCSRPWGASWLGVSPLPANGIGNPLVPCPGPRDHKGCWGECVAFLPFVGRGMPLCGPHWEDDRGGRLCGGWLASALEPRSCRWQNNICVAKCCFVVPQTSSSQ